MPRSFFRVLPLLLLTLAACNTAQPPSTPTLAPQVQDYSFVSKWGTQGTGDGQFDRPIGIAVDSNDNVYVLEFNNNRIQKFDSSGTFITKWGTQGSADGQFNRPIGIAVDSNDNVYVADSYNHRIQKFTSSGNFLSKWGTNGTGDGQFQYPVGIAIGSSGYVYVTDLYNYRIQVFDSSGAFITKWGSLGSSDFQFNDPYGLAFDSSGTYFFVADSGNNRIQKISGNGLFYGKWGTQGSADGQFNRPVGIVVDSSDNVYVTDSGNNRIQKFDSSGNFLSKWGTNGTGDGQFNGPFSVAVGSSSNVYVADTDNHRIQKFTLKQSQSISFTSAAPTDASVGQTYTATATATSGLAVTFASITPSVCTVSAGTVSFVAAGTCTITADQAGNEYYEPAPQVSQSFTVNVADTTAPSITLSTPADGAVYVQGQSVVVDYTCTDEEGGSGIANCTGAQADGATLDTSTPGSYSFKVDAQDTAGNTSSVTHNYTVSPFIPVTPEQYTINFETAPINSLLYSVSTGKGIIYGGAGSAQNKTVPIVGKRALNGRILEGQSAKVMSLYGSKRLVVSSSTVNAPATTGGRLKLTFTNFAPQGVTLTSLTVSNLTKSGAYLTFYYVSGTSSRQNLGTTPAGGSLVVSLAVKNLRAVDLYAPNAYSVDDLVFEVPVQ